MAIERGGRRRWLGVAVLVVLAALLIAACAQANTPAPSVAASAGASAAATASASPAATPAPTPLVPASPGADPVSLLAWAFTPVFQVLFIILVALYALLGNNIALAIVILTLIIRALVIPLFRQQTVSQRRMQLLQPELKEIQRRYKGDRTKVLEAQQALYKERGINPAAGCLPLLLQFVLLIPMYSVIRDGLTNYNPEAMLSVFGVKLINLGCSATPLLDPITHAVKPCINPFFMGVDLSKPEIFWTLPGIGFGLSFLAILAGVLQLIQSRMVMPPSTGDSDQSTAVQRQTMIIFPLISVAYGAFLPAGLFIYWIVTTVFSIVQQYLIVGFGSLFPLFGWTPGFAVDHKPRFPVAAPTPVPPGKGTPASTQPSSTARSAASRAASAAATVRPRERGGRQGRRGRRR